MLAVQFLDEEIKRKSSSATRYRRDINQWRTHTLLVLWFIDRHNIQVDRIVEDPLQL